MVPLTEWYKPPNSIPNCERHGKTEPIEWSGVIVSGLFTTTSGPISLARPEIDVSEKKVNCSGCCNNLRQEFSLPVAEDVLSKTSLESMI